MDDRYGGIIHEPEPLPLSFASHGVMRLDTGDSTILIVLVDLALELCKESV